MGKKYISLSIIIGFLLLFIFPLISASTGYVIGYISNAEDGKSPDGMRMMATNELGEVQYDTIGIDGNSRNHNQYKFTLRGDLEIKVIQNGDYFSDMIKFKESADKYSFVPEIQLKKVSSFEKLGYEPFTITENTIYDFDFNTIYVNVTNNMPEDATVNLQHVFNKNRLTEQIQYTSIEILQDIEVEVFETKVVETEVSSEVETNIINDKNKNKESNIKNKTTDSLMTETKYYDKYNNELDKFKIKEKTIYNNKTNESTVIKYEEKIVSTYIGNITKVKYKDKTSDYVFRSVKPVTSKQRQEYKYSQENIEIASGETVNLRLTYDHAPVFKENIPTPSENKYDIVVCTTDKEFCTILDPTWFNESWSYYKEYTNLTGNFTYMEINITSNDNSDWNDTRFISCYNESLIFNHTLEAEIGTYGQFRVNNLGENCTLRYYGNSGATSISSASDTYFNPIASYYFDANANDSVGSNHGTVSGATLSDGYINGSYDFVRTNSDNIVVADDPSLRLTTGSISVWINPDMNNAYLIDKGVNNNQGYAMIYRDDTTFDFLVKTNLGFALITDMPVSVGVWSHLVMTFDDVAKELKVYQNGVQYSTTYDFSGESVSTGNDNLGIGYEITTNAKYWDGNIDDILIYDKVLTSDQIYRLYTQTAPNIVEGEEQSQTADITVTTPTWETQSGQTSGNLTFLQTTKYINTTSISNVSYMTLTITDPDSTVSLTVNMTNSSLSDWYYDTEFSFDKVGIWTLGVEGFKDGSSATNSTTLLVTINQISTKDGWYGCEINTQNGYTTEQISRFSGYDCDLLEEFIDFGANAEFDLNDTIWELKKDSINRTKNANMKVGINLFLDFNLNYTSNVTGALSTISSRISDLTLTPYTDAIEYISLEIANPQLYNTSIKNSVLNEFAQNLTSVTESQFVIYSKNYNNESLDSSYISFTSFFYVDNNTQSSLIEQENILLRNNVGLNRIYVSLSDPLMSQTQSYQNNILDNLRGSPAGSTSIPNTNVAEIDLEINDIIVFNNQSTNQTYSINITSVAEMLTKDVWDSIKGYLIEKDTDGLFEVNVSNYSATNIFIDNFSHIQYGSIKSTLFKESASVGGHFNYTQNTSRDDLYGMYGANDASVELWDSTYESNTFIDYYGWFNASFVSNWSRYDIIIFDDENPSEVADVLAQTETKGTKMFGYVAVSDYNDSDAWTNAKKIEIDNILALNESGRLHIFIDGLDLGIGGTNFSSRMKDLVDYVKIENNRDVGLNTYTAYQDFCSWSKPGGFCMRESCVRRWDNTLEDPVYSWENWTLELEKSTWFNSHGVQVVCQAFENRTNDGTYRLENHTILQDSYFASLVLGYTDFYMSQPDFQYAHEINLYNVGDDLSNTYSIHSEDNNTYYRRYSNGIVYYNTTSHHGWIEDGREFDGITMCFNLVDSNDAPDAEAIDFGFKVNGGNLYTIPAEDIVWSSGGNWYCKNVNSTDYSDNGYYFVTMQPHNRNPTSGNAINIDNSLNQEGTGRHSYWDNLAGGEPFSWNIYEQDKNWMVDLEINQTKSASSDTTNEITQLNATNNSVTNLTLSSTYGQDIEVWSTFIEQDMSEFNNLTYWNGSEKILLYPENTTDCSELSPTFNSTNISGEIHKSCINDNGFRVASPSLSTRIYILDATPSDTLAPLLEILYPEATNYNADTNPSELNYSVNDTDGNLDSCWYNTGGSNITLVCGNNVTGLNTSEGSNTWTIYANDTYGNINISNVTFNVDSILPNITVNSPLNTSYGTSSIEFNVTANDTNIDSCFYSLDEGDNITLIGIGGDEKTYEFFEGAVQSTSGVGQNYWEAQTFTVGNVGDNVQYTLNSIDLYLEKSVSPVNVTFEIRETNSSGYPIGSSISEVTLNSDLLPSSDDWYTIDMPEVVLNASTKYAIVMSCDDFESYISGRLSSGANYSGGSAFSSSDSGSSWSEITNLDYLFRVNGTSESDIYTSTNSSMTGGDHNATFYCNDTYGNLQSSLALFSVNLGDPIITIINPVVGEDEKTQPVNFAINLSRVGTCDLNIYSENYSMTTGDNILFTYSKVLEIGYSTATFYCNDTIGNSANSSISFYVYPTVSGGGSVSGDKIILDVPEVVDDSVEEVVKDKKTKISQVIDTVTDNIKESAEEIKGRVSKIPDWLVYLIVLISILIIILVIILR